jgi:hypothetical protein
MTAWNDIYAEICDVVNDMEFTPAYFRGQPDARWKLLPGMGRVPATRYCRIQFPSDARRELGIFRHFKLAAGELLDKEIDAWELAYAMQHYGLPTRFLDWSMTFSIALFFALRGAMRAAAIWVLDPFALNAITMENKHLFNPEESPETYEDYFITRSTQPPGAVVAVAPGRHNPRLFSQRGAFTMHDDLDRPLNEIVPSAVHKFVLPKHVHPDARKFLEMAGVSEFSLFPDLDGLARELRDQHFVRRRSRHQSLL